MDFDKFNSLNQICLNLYEQGRFDEAIKYFDKLIIMAPNDYNLHNAKGNAHYALYQFQEALNSYDAALSLNPMEPTIWKNKGFALAGLSEFQDALICLDQALNLDPSLNIYSDKGFCLEKLGNLEEALYFYDRALELNPFDKIAIEHKKNILNAIENKKIEDKLLDNDLEGLIKGLESENVVTRRKSVKALGRLYDKKAIPALKKSLNDDDFHVRKYVKEALDHIKIDCPICNFINEYNDLVCRECGYDFKIIKEIDNDVYAAKCSDCGFENLKNAKFCSDCGNKLEFNISSTNSNIDINTASEEQIALIQGIGPILAKKAIKIRESKEGFDSIEDFFLSLELKPHIAKNIESLIICKSISKTKDNKNSRRIVDF